MRWEDGEVRQGTLELLNDKVVATVLFNLH